MTESFESLALQEHATLLRYRKALEEIAEGKGRYSSDRFEHACNTIADMKQIALDALAGAVSTQKDPQ